MASDNVQYIGYVGGLAQIVSNALIGDVIGGFAVCRHDDYRDIGESWVLQLLGPEFLAVHAAHHQIQQDQARQLLATLKQLKSLTAVKGSSNHITFHFKQVEE